MERSIVYQMTPADLRQFFNEEAEKREKAERDARYDDILQRCENVLVDIKFVAKMNNISTATVRNYIRDGLVTPELRIVEKGEYKFRLSYALMLDFAELKQKLLRRKYA